MENNLYKTLLGIVLVFSLACPAHAIDEIYIPGYVCPYGATCLTGDNMYWYMTTHYGSYPSYPNYYYGAADGEQKKKTEEEQRQCNSNASGAGYLCKNAYESLGKMCNGLNGLSFAGAGSAAKWLVGKLSKEAEIAFGVAQSGAALFGASEDDAMIPCTVLNDRAMAFCAAGEKKMHDTCNK